MTASIGALEVLVDRAAAGLPGELADRDLARLWGPARRDDDRQLTEASVGTRAPDASFPGASGRPDSPLGLTAGDLAPRTSPGRADPFDPGDSWRLEMVVEELLRDLPEDGSDPRWGAPWPLAAAVGGLFRIGPSTPGNAPLPDGLEAGRAETRRRLASWLADRRTT